MPKVPYLYEVNGKLVTGNGSLIPICSLSNRSLLPSLTVYTILTLKSYMYPTVQHTFKKYSFTEGGFDTFLFQPTH